MSIDCKQFIITATRCKYSVRLACWFCCLDSTPSLFSTLIFNCNYQLQPLVENLKIWKWNPRETENENLVSENEILVIKKW